MHRHTTAEAATHLLPPLRDSGRHDQLERILRDLWNSDQVAIRQCAGCGFCFADPFIAASAEIYNLITGGHEYYPRDRFEFGETIGVLRVRPVERLLEIGGGRGAFVRKALAARVVRDAVTLEYDEAAIDALSEIPGNVPFQGSVQELVSTSPGQFDAICMFQVLEHMDHIDEVFSDLAVVSRRDADVFIAVPNAPRTEAQERLTRFWDMPPQHVGRWTRQALTATAGRAGFAIKDERCGPASTVGAIWGLAKFRWEARAYHSRSFAAKVNGISDRRIRGPIKRSLAVWDFLALSPHLGRVPPLTRWFHLTRL